MRTKLVACRLLFFVLLSFPLAPTWAAIIVYDNDLDFSDTTNPNGTWSYQQGNALLTHFTPLPQAPLNTAAANGYWGTSSSSVNGAILRTTANGSSTGLWNDLDFLAGDVLVRTTDPMTGAPATLTWTAPQAGSLTYAGLVWYAGAPQGPWSNDFTLTFNAGPVLESGSAGLGINRQSSYNLVGGMLPISVSAGDTLSLELTPSIGMPTGSWAGVIWTIDFQPVPEPSGLVLGLIGTICLGVVFWRRAT